MIYIYQYNVRNNNPPYHLPGFYMCDRSSPLGNPHPLERESARVQVVSQYERLFAEQSQEGGSLAPHIDQLYNTLMDLQYVILGCWCVPKPCHTDVIAKHLLERCLAEGHEATIKRYAS